LNEWFGIEGNVATGFAPESLIAECVLTTAADPRSLAAEKRELAHAIVVSTRTAELPTTAKRLMVELWRRRDYRINPRFQDGWERIGYTGFGQSQNNFADGRARFHLTFRTAGT
jgi:hypothetical protein